MKGNGKIIGEKNETSRAGASGVFDSFDQNIAQISEEWPGPLLLSNIQFINAHSGSETTTIREKQDYQINLNGELYSLGTNYYYSIDEISTSYLNSTYFKNSLTGQVTGTGTTIAILNSTMGFVLNNTRPDVTFRVSLRYGSASGTIVLQSPIITLPAANVTYQITPSNATDPAVGVDEGSPVTYNWISQGAYYQPGAPYSYRHRMYAPSTTSGDLTWPSPYTYYYYHYGSSTTGSLRNHPRSYTVKADNTTEGPESHSITFQTVKDTGPSSTTYSPINPYTGSQPSTIYINDTSLDPVLDSVTLSGTTTAESSLTVYLNASSNVIHGRPIHYRVVANGTSTIALSDMYSPPTGVAFANSSGNAAITIYFNDDPSYTEGSEYLVVEGKLDNDDFTTGTVRTSPVITVTDSTTSDHNPGTAFSDVTFTAAGFSKISGEGPLAIWEKRYGRDNDAYNTSSLSYTHSHIGQTCNLTIIACAGGGGGGGSMGGGGGAGAAIFFNDYIASASQSFTGTVGIGGHRGYTSSTRNTGGGQNGSNTTITSNSQTFTLQAGGGGGDYSLGANASQSWAGGGGSSGRPGMPTSAQSQPNTGIYAAATFVYGTHYSGNAGTYFIGGGGSGLLGDGILGDEPALGPAKQSGGNGAFIQGESLGGGGAGGIYSPSSAPAYQDLRPGQHGGGMSAGYITGNNIISGLRAAQSFGSGGGGGGYSSYYGGDGGGAGGNGVVIFRIRGDGRVIDLPYDT